MTFVINPDTSLFTITVTALLSTYRLIHVSLYTVDLAVTYGRSPRPLIYLWLLSQGNKVNFCSITNEINVQ